MTTDRTLATLTAYIEAHPPPPRRVLTAAEQAAEDYAATVGERQRDEARMADVDDRWMQERVDNNLTREWAG